MQASGANRFDFILSNYFDLINGSHKIHFSTNGYTVESMFSRRIE